MGEKWKCHICGQVRPAKMISVRSKQVDVKGFAVTENIRYCNDKPGCIEASKTFSLIKGAS